jgi:CheY-like chemotaxis protein
MPDCVQDSPVPGLPSKPNRGRILVVDDYQPIREIVKVFLGRRGFDVYEAADAAEAIAKVEILKPDLIVVDLAMPELNGVELASILRQRLPGAPIVALTMYEQFFGPTLALAVGVSAVISKSDGMDKLVDCVEALVSPKPAHVPDLAVS